MEQNRASAGTAPRGDFAHGGQIPRGVGEVEGLSFERIDLNSNHEQRLGIHRPLGEI